MAIARRPDLWRIALTEMFRMAAPGWWRRAPFLPVADPKYLAFRAVTQYGSEDHSPEAGDVVAWLEWCRNSGRRIPRLRR